MTSALTPSSLPTPPQVNSKSNAPSETTPRIHHRPWVADSATKLALLCGILALLTSVGVDVPAAVLWKGYSFSAQSLSQLIAVGTPTRTIVLPIVLGHDLLLVGFGLGVWMAALAVVLLRKQTA